jgi:hypothetical protein
MSFIKPNLFSDIDECLHEAFPHHKNISFGGHSIILFGDMGKFPPVTEILIYAKASCDNTLW